jgi:subtilase family protein
LPFIERVEIMPRYRPAQVALAGNAGEDGDDPEWLGSEVRLGPIPDGLPTVVVADTGLPHDGPLAPLIRERASFIMGPSDPTHATPVAALIAAQRDSLLTGLLIPRAALVDARVFSSDDEDVLEEEMTKRIEAAARLLGPSYKIWNFSMACEPGPRPQWHSDLGQRMDELRHEHNLIFVSAAGNRQPENPRIAFPPVSEDDDWIYAPGDALRNITATSLAPDDISASVAGVYARPHEPSPFAGRGLTPEGALLPLIAEYGGNVTTAGNLIGIPSVDTRGRLCQVAGTSMAAPLVTGTLAELAQCFSLSLAQQNLLSDFDPLLLAKAALFHNSRIPSIMSGGANLGEYFGFGVPPTLEELTGDQAWRATTFIATTLAPNGIDLVIDPFPFPEGLRLDDYWRGEILLTLVTEPLLGSGKTREYVRSDIDLKLGPARTDAVGEIHIKPNQLVLDTRFPTARFEVDRIKREQKWSPFRRYYVRLASAGIKAERWALSAHMGVRAEEQRDLQAARDDKRHPNRYTDQVELQRMQVVIAVTILDPQRIASVRDQVLNQWKVRGNIPAQVAIAPRLRSRFIAQ